MADQLRFGRTWVYHNRRVDYQTEAQIKEDVRHSARAAEEWKTVCEGSRHKEPLVILQRIEPGEWWLLCARREGVRATDHRPVIAVYLAELMETPKVETLWGWMQAFARDCKDGIVPKAIGSFPGADLEMENEEAIASTALALALLYHWALPPGQLPYLDEEWIALETVPWILSCGKIPEKLPASKGLLVNEKKLAQLPPMIESIFDRSVEDIRKLRLPGLMGCGAGEIQRMRLVKKALGFQKVTLEDQPLTVPTLQWMLRQPYLRREAFERVQESQLREFLARIIHAEGEELSLLKPKLNLERDRAEVIRLLLQQKPDAIPHHFEQYLDLFAAETEPPIELLSAEERQIWSYLQEETDTLSSPGSVHTVFRLLRGRKVHHRFKLKRVAWAVKNRVEDAAPVFRALLREQGLPDDLIAALTESRPLKSPLEWPPALEPHDHWLRGISAKAFLSLPVSQEAEAWWLKGIDYFVQKKELSFEELLKAGCQRVSLPLLERAKAPESVLALVDSQRPRVEITDSLDWPTEVGVLLDRLVTDNRLWSRLNPPMSLLSIRGVVGRIDSKSLRQPLMKALGQLDDGTPASLDSLRSLAPLLESTIARKQLRHLLPLKPFPCDLFATLLDCWKGEEKVAWLRARCLTGDPLPVGVLWSVADMLDFFPLLDAVNDILLVVLNRDTVEPCEGDLLARLVEHFRLRPPIAVGYHPDWAERRRNWIEALAPLLGWPFLSETSP